MSIMAKRVLHLILLAIFSIGVIGILLFSLSPDVLIGEKEHHFGVVQIERPNETLMHTFYLQNNTNHPLQLKDAIPSCGCTTVEFNNEMVDPGETFLEAMKRELEEETSIKNIKILKELDYWLEYELPKNLIGIIWKGKYRGQKQKWFITRFLGSDSEINLNTKKPEFIEWKWIEVNELPNVIVDFKKDVYKKLVKEMNNFIV